MKIGYARVSKGDQTTAPQLLELEQAGCDVIYQDTASALATRPELEAALAALNEGDSLTVWKFDRLARSLPDLLRVIGQIEQRGAHLHSITEKIDTASSAGRMVFHVMGAVGQFERDLISDRTKAGLVAASAAGRVGGRPRALSPSQVAHAMQLIESGESPSQVARTLKVATSTLRARIAEQRSKF